MKTCNKCKIEKEYHSFHRNKSYKDGFISTCKECSRSGQREAYYRRRSAALKRKVTYNKENRAKQQEQKRTYYKRRMKEVLDLLGDKCNRCGIKDKRLLQIDHIHGKGTQHRKSKNNAWWKIMTDIKNSIQSNKGEYQLLCANCNLLEAIEKGYKKSIWIEEALGEIK